MPEARALLETQVGAGLDNKLHHWPAPTYGSETIAAFWGVGSGIAAPGTRAGPDCLRAECHSHAFRKNQWLRRPMLRQAR